MGTSASRGTRRRRTLRSALLGWLQGVKPQLVPGILVELAVELAAVCAPVVLAHETLVPDGVAHDAGLFDQDLLLQAVDHLLPPADLDVVIEHDQAVGMRLAPNPRHFAAPPVVRGDDRP